MLICILSYLNIALSSGSYSHWYAKRLRGFTEHHFGWLSSFSENAHISLTSGYIWSKFSILMYFNIVQPLPCKTVTRLRRASFWPVKPLKWRASMMLFHQNMHHSARNNQFHLNNTFLLAPETDYYMSTTGCAYYCQLYYISRVVKNLSSWFPTRSNTNRAERPKAVFMCTIWTWVQIYSRVHICIFLRRVHMPINCVNTFVDLIQIKYKGMQFWGKIRCIFSKRQ